MVVRLPVIMEKKVPTRLRALKKYRAICMTEMKSSRFWLTKTMPPAELATALELTEEGDYKGFEAVLKSHAAGQGGS